MQICKLGQNSIKQALDLVWDVFEECDVKDYEPGGVKTFQLFIRYDNIVDKIKTEDMVFFGAYEASELIGVIAMRSGFHISLLFVRPQYHRRGAARMLIRRAVAYCLDLKPDLHAITVNASPYGVEAYRAMGFYPLTREQKKDGIRFTPMRIDV